MERSTHLLLESVEMTLAPVLHASIHNYSAVPRCEIQANGVSQRAVQLASIEQTCISTTLAARLYAVSAVLAPLPTAADVTPSEGFDTTAACHWSALGFTPSASHKRRAAVYNVLSEPSRRRLSCRIAQRRGMGCA